MYNVDENDRVIELAKVPQSSVGAPAPFVISDGSQVVLAYYMQETPTEGDDGATIRIVGPSDGDRPIAIVRFAFCNAHYLGMPNDEAFEGHPLESRGLKPYGVFEIKNSSWIRRLERMNSAHPFHRPKMFWRKRHLIFAFHDNTFECVCDGFDVRTAQGAIKSVVPEMIKLLPWVD